MGKIMNLSFQTNPMLNYEIKKNPILNERVIWLRRENLLKDFSKDKKNNHLGQSNPG
jgi:hypothetical protein